MNNVQRITIKDVAKEAGVSISSVSRYMNDISLRQHIYEKVDAAVRDLGYKENYYAKSLRQKPSITICVMINLFSEQFQALYLDQINHLCYSNNIELVVISHSSYQIPFEKHLDFIKSRMIDGVAMFIDYLDDKLIDQINNFSKEVPVVVVDTMSPKLHASAVLLDNFNASYNATQFLIDKGHRKIGIITGTQRMLSFTERLAGSRHALEYNGIPFRNEYVHFTDYNHQDDAYAEAIKLFSLPDPPTAIFAHTYHMTFGVIMASRDLKLSIPDDISVVGYDYYSIKNSIAPNVTCVDQPLSELAHISFDVLMSHIKSGQKFQSLDLHRVPATFIDNNSVKNLRSLKV